MRTWCHNSMHKLLSQHKYNTRQLLNQVRSIAFNWSSPFCSRCWLSALMISVFDLLGLECTYILYGGLWGAIVFCWVGVLMFTKYHLSVLVNILLAWVWTMDPWRYCRRTGLCPAICKDTSWFKIFTNLYKVATYKNLNLYF